MGSASTRFDSEATCRRLLGVASRADRLTHLEVLPRRDAQYAEWPDWLPAEVVAACQRRGIDRLWSHQAQAANLARRGQSVIVATGTASGKSLAYLLPAFAAVAESVADATDRGETVLYLAPTKALAHDQLAGLRRFGLPAVRATTYDGDSSREERTWARSHANFLLTNPDMVHRSLLPGHARWSSFLGGLRYVVVDESHHYRGIFGAHVAQVIRRLRRLAAHYGASPTFVLASATASSPDLTATRLVGEPVTAVTRDGSPRGATTVALWEPPFTSLLGEQGAPLRRSAAAESADLVADLVAEGVRTLAFIRSRRGAESVAQQVQNKVMEVDPELVKRVAPYRGGFLPEDRRDLEARLRSGELLAVAATNALELGLDISGLDAVVLAGFPGTRSSMWQQLGRAGRGADGGLGILVARDDPLDTYLVTHPEALLGTPVEAAVFDPGNPYVLAPHLCAAADELPITEAELTSLSPSAREVVDTLEAEGYLRRRTRGWFWTRRERAADLADLRSTSGPPVRIVEQETGRLVGTVDFASADATVHPGAVYLHLGETYLVQELDLQESVAMVKATDATYTTSAREVTDIAIVSTERLCDWGKATMHFGSVEVTSQIASFLKRRIGSGEILGETPLDLPARHLVTKATWWTLSDDAVDAAGVDPRDVPGAAHAAEHASIGLLPLFATCDRWDIGGVSTALHPDTGDLTVFVYDGHPGGAGFSERGFATAEAWLTATREAISSCSCDSGCPSCVQSPKCGNGNSPLDKGGAVRLLNAVLATSADPAPAA